MATSRPASKKEYPFFMTCYLQNTISFSASVEEILSNSLLQYHIEDGRRKYILVERKNVSNYYLAKSMPNRVDCLTNGR
jgi:hypothetical protein